MCSVAFPDEIQHTTTAQPSVFMQMQRQHNTESAPTTQVGQLFGQAVSCDDETELADRVLIKEFVDELLQQQECEIDSCRLQIGIQHRPGNVDDNKDMANNPALNCVCVFESAIRSNQAVLDDKTQRIA